MTDKIPVLVTGVGGGGVGEQVLKCLRMAQTGYQIIGGDMRPNSKGFALVDKPYILPSVTDPRYIDCVLELCKKHGIKALFPGSEPELKTLSLNRARFIDRGIFMPLNPQRVIDICMDKNKTMTWFKENGFDLPKSVCINSQEALEAVDFLPAVLKPSVGAGGSTHTYLARDRRELLLFGGYLLELYSEFIAQEYVGTPESEYTAGVLHDLEGNYLNAIAVKKDILSGLSNRLKIPNTTGNPKYGMTLAISNGVSQGEIGRFPQVTEPCKQMARKLGCTCSMNLQCRVQDGKVYVFEINPRISGTSPLRAMVGYNEPDILIRRHVLGESIQPDFPYETGYIARGLDERFISKTFMEGIETL